MTILLLDAYNLLYRSFISLPAAITNRDGLPINAVYGTLGSGIRLVREHQPEGVVAAFDEPDTPTFRHRLYPPYQGHRGPLGGERADDFARQVRVAREILPLLGIPAVSAAGFEADDVMGTIVCRLRDGGRSSVTVSTDRDLLQLVGMGVAVLVPGNPPRAFGTEDEVRERMGVPPVWIPDFKALAGDPSDNIPGVRGIGIKTAADLINRYQGLDGTYAAVPLLAPRVRTALEAGREDAYLFRRVATIATDVPLSIDASTLPIPAIGAESKPRQLLEEHGFG